MDGQVCLAYETLPSAINNPPPGSIRIFKSSVDGNLYYKKPDGSIVPIASGGGSGVEIKDEFTPAIDGQTVFNLSNIPAIGNIPEVFINGVLQDDISDYTLAGVVLTWLNNGFSLDTTDKIIVIYNI